MSRVTRIMSDMIQEWQDVLIDEMLHHNSTYASFHKICDSGSWVVGTQYASEQLIVPGKN